jgi:ketosteroid isomerase-like protein
LDAGASDVKLEAIEVAGSGTLVYEVGEFSAMMPQPTGGTAPGSGKYLVVYERQMDGTLRLAADMFSPNA